MTVLMVIHILVFQGNSILCTCKSEIKISHDIDLPYQGKPLAAPFDHHPLWWATVRFSVADIT